MTQVTITMPSPLANLPIAEQDSLLRAGLFEAMRARMRQLVSEIEESQKHIQYYEAKYGNSLAQFESEQLPELDTLQAHEDYTDWFFWNETWRQHQQVLDELQKVGDS
jgi:hypothetical protein